MFNINCALLILHIDTALIYFFLSINVLIDRRVRMHKFLMSCHFKIACHTLVNLGNYMIIPVVMAGGTGSRLWPLSREHFPKQFLPLYGEHTMLQETLLRLDGIQMQSPIVITNEVHRFIVAEQLRQLKQLKHNIILEPFGRNTAPAIALAALACLQDPEQENAILLVLAADHIIKSSATFIHAIQQASVLAQQGDLVTFGIVPTAPETGYGYIQRGDAKGDAYKVARFVEKPQAKIAQAYYESGEYYWNSGMFMFTAKRYLEELEKFNPDILKACESALLSGVSDADFIRVEADAFASCPEDSIDYAVMEKTSDAVVIPLDAGWNDIGSWSALWDVNEKDAEQNVVSGDVFLENTHNSFIKSDDKFIATIGVDNLIVVSTKDAVLVVDKNQVQDVKKVVEYLKKSNRTEHINHRETYRPWGKYDVIEIAEGFQINRITIKPGGRFSLQMHYHRSEHWSVMRGTAKITIEGIESLVTENQSIFIPIGKIHRLENAGKIPLELIEVRSGSYLEEDDIVRIEEA